MYHWYRNIISNYKKDKASGTFAGHKVYQFDEQTGEIKKEQVVHIFKPENLSEAISIDEKMIGKKYSTIVSSQQTGKIALLVETMNPVMVKQALELFGKEKLQQVKDVSSDMSPLYKNLCKTTFANAQNTVDKFHVIKHVMDALNNVRLDIKNKLKQSDTPNHNNPNQWTDIEFLEKCKYLLYKRQQFLDKEEQELLNKLLSEHQLLKQAYELVEQIREWYDSKNVGKTLYIIEQNLEKILNQMTQSKIKPFKFIVKMFEKHWDEIISYFEHGYTNAKAENLNARIQRFLINNYGTRDKDFFFYRTQVYFS